MPDHFQMESRAGSRPGQRVVRLSGRLGLDTVQDFLKNVRATGDPVIILDMGGLSYIDSAGVGSLVQTFASFKKSQRQLALTGVNDRVRAVLEVTRVSNLIPSYASVSDAEQNLVSG
jgi:anti-sigma B factor antagonist